MASRSWKEICILLMTVVTLVTYWNRRRVCRSSHVSTMDVGSMSPVNLTGYLYWSNAASCRIAHDFGGKFTKLKKHVSYFDGHKKMCMDKQFRPEVNNCVVYSFGINDEWSFDEAVEKMGCQIYAFDPTMNQEDHDHSKNIHFYNLGIGDADVDDHPVSRWKIRTLQSVYKMLTPKHGDVAIDYVKLDVEMFEWTVIPHMIRTGILDKVKQLAVELHFHVGKQPPEHVRKCMRVIRHLEEYGMIRFASRANYYALNYVMGKLRHNIFELVWYNRKFLK